MVNEEFNIKGYASEIFEMDLEYLRNEIAYILSEIDRAITMMRRRPDIPEVILSYLENIHAETFRMSLLYDLMFNKAHRYKPNNIALRNFLGDYGTSYIGTSMAWADTAEAMYKSDPYKNRSNVLILLTKLKNLLKEADLKLIEAINNGLFM